MFIQRLQLCDRVNVLNPWLQEIRVSDFKLAVEFVSSVQLFLLLCSCF